MSTEKANNKVQIWAERLQCPVDADDNTYHNTYWCNRDLVPIPPDRQTWTWQGYAGYWAITGINTTAWTAGSSLLALGLSVPQSMGVMVGVAFITALIAVLAGWPGSHQHLGFTVLCRASWGMRGGFWPVLNRIVTAIIWLGIQLYWGGQAVKIILGAIIGPKFVFWKNTLPASANVDTASLVSFFVFVVIFLPCLMIPPERLQVPLRVTFVMITLTMFGILGWAVGTNGGPGSLLHTPSKTHGSAHAWAALYGLQSIVGSQASGCLGQSDWTRYAKTPNAALLGQAVTAPIAIIVTSVCGLLITSAAAEIFDGVYLWNPFELLLYAQKTSLTAGCRAGTFFAGLGFLSSQLALCIILNCVSAGMDMAALCPKWINIRRGGYIVSIIAIAICPWQYVTQPTTFITVLSGWSVFLSPMTGVLLSDYFLVRKREYHLGDLYTGNTSSAYWYHFGFNWRGILAWAMGTWPTLPGFALSVQKETTSTGWDHVYEMAYFYGFFSAFVLYYLLYLLFPVAKQTGDSPFVLAEHRRALTDAQSESSGDVTLFETSAPCKAGV